MYSGVYIGKVCPGIFVTEGTLYNSTVLNWQFGKVCAVHLGTEWNLNNAANLNWQFFKVCVFKFALKGIFAM